MAEPGTSSVTFMYNYSGFKQQQAVGLNVRSHVQRDILWQSNMCVIDERRRHHGNIPSCR